MEQSKKKKRLAPSKLLVCPRCGHKVPHALVNADQLLYKCNICGTLQSTRK